MQLKTKQTPQNNKPKSPPTKANLRQGTHKKDDPGHSQGSFSGVILRDSVSKGKTAAGSYSPEVSKP